MDYENGIQTKIEEIDIGFVLWANDEVKKYLKQQIDWDIEGEEDYHEFLKLTQL